MKAHVWASSGAGGHRGVRTHVELIIYFDGPWPDAQYRDLDKDFLDLPLGQYNLEVRRVEQQTAGPYNTPGYMCRRLIISRIA